MKCGFWISCLLVLVLTSLSANAQLAEQWRWKYGATSSSYNHYHDFVHISPHPGGGYYLVDQVYADDRYDYYGYWQSDLLHVEENADQTWRVMGSRDLGGGQLADLDIGYDEGMRSGTVDPVGNGYGYTCYMDYKCYYPSGQIRYSGTGSNDGTIADWLGAVRIYPDLSVPGDAGCTFIAYTLDYNAGDYYSPADIRLKLKRFDGDGEEVVAQDWDLGYAWSGDTVAKVVNSGLVKSANQIYLYVRGKNFPFSQNQVDADYLVMVDGDLNFCWAVETPDFNPNYQPLGETVSMQLTRDRSLLLQSAVGIGKYTPNGEQLWFTNLDQYVSNAVTIDVPTNPTIYYFVGYNPLDDNAPVLGVLSETGELIYVQEIPGLADASSVYVDGLYNVVVGGAIQDHNPYYNVYYERAILIGYGNTSGVPGEDSEAVRQFTLHPVYPNPFNSTTTISVDVAQPSLVNLSVFDVLGREVAVLREGWTVSPGTHQVAWDASNVAGGTYFLHASVGDQQRTQRLVLVK